MTDCSLDQSLADAMTSELIVNNHIFDPVFVTCKGRAEGQGKHSCQSSLVVLGSEQSKPTFLQEPVHLVSIDGAEARRKFMQKKIYLLLHALVNLMYYADIHALCLWEEALLDKLLGNLDCICGGTLAEIVSHTPEVET